MEKKSREFSLCQAKIATLGAVALPYFPSRVDQKWLIKIPLDDLEKKLALWLNCYSERQTSNAKCSLSSSDYQVPMRVNVAYVLSSSRNNCRYRLCSKKLNKNFSRT